MEFKKKFEDLSSVKELFKTAEEKIEQLLRKAINVRDTEIDNLNRGLQRLNQEKENLEKRIIDLKEKIECKDARLSQLGNENKALRKINETLKNELGKLLPDIEGN